MEENREKMEKTEKLTEEILYIQEEFDKIGVKTDQSAGISV